MKKLSAKTVWLYAVYTATVLGGAKILGGALSFGAFVGAVYATNPVVACVLYVASSLVDGTNSLMHAGVRAAVIMTFVYIHKLAKRKIGKGALLLYMLLANTFYLAYGFVGYTDLCFKALYVVVGIAFGYVSIYMYRAVFVKGLNYRPATDEKVCIALYGVAASYCLSCFTLWQFQPIYFVMPFAVLFCVSAFNDETAFVCASVAAVGNLAAIGQLQFAVCCVVVALAAVSLIRVNRYVCALSVVAADVVVSYFFNLHGRFDTIVFIPTATSVLVYIVIPGRVYRRIKDTVCGGSDRYLGTAVSHKLGMALSGRLYRLSDIFLSMRNAFYSVSSGRVSADDAEKAMVRQVSEEVCSRCNLRTTCWREQLQDTEQSLLNMTVCAVKRGKCTILDVSPSLSMRCERVSGIISQINERAKNYAEYVNRTEQADNSRTLVGEQMGGVSGLLLQLAGEAKTKAVTDSDKEADLVDRLVFHNVMCIGATVMQQYGLPLVFATVSARDTDADVVEQVTSAVVNQPMKVQRIEATDSPDWNTVILCAKPRFEAVYGIASVTKEGSALSGDTHSVINTDNGKCIVALCDGMGSGVRAEEMSSASIDLVESFYRAGFDSDVILTCVNKLLTGCGNEVFCAVDMMVVDLYNGLADFIKLGATNGLVRCGDKVEIVSGSSLPLGVLDEMHPSVTKKAMHSGDYAVLFTDGVTDCFHDINALAEIFRNTTLTNPQSIAEDIINKALKQVHNKAADDMTVLVCKLV